MILAKMAWADGNISPEEEGFLRQHSDGTDLAALLEEAKNTDLVELAQRIELYPDKFFIAFRAANMALIDDNFDEAEQQLFERLCKLFGLEPQDQALIRETVDQLRSDPFLEPPQKLIELFGQSSFG